jgi:hypothetical protein
MKRISAGIRIVRAPGLRRDMIGQVVASETELPELKFEAGVKS